MITIIDYGMGNLRSVQKAFELFYPEVRIGSSFEDILTSDKVVLPGVGAFSKAMDELKKRNLLGAIADVVKKGMPFLGICLGLQLLFTESEEGGTIEGLGILKGRVRRFADRDGLKIPHMGWNKIKSEIRNPTLRQAQGRPEQGRGTKSEILKNVPDNSFMYFVHSYYVEPEDRGVVLCETEYGLTFTSGVQKDNIYGFQFHPEKSQGQGLKIIKNFAAL
ncbi:MAG: imidazole glycerol phosphate synthase subunit HisH [Candidatus Omnitrophica bacterium]|nr:imidazole glycerol phosphate synthase subunit HisH [Candidatus Omnitrophota bacterium]